jgi:murein DD-endopeptidase MepM/ murein hydrolase activator NlpD
MAAPIGTPIYAVLDGVVVYSDARIKGYGNLIVIRSPDLLHVYGHNNKNYVRVGDKVKRGQRIGEVGETGRVTGPHLHFETRIKDQNGKNVAIDPLVFFVRKP